MTDTTVDFQELTALGCRVLQADDLLGRDPGLDGDNFAAGVAVLPKSPEDVQGIVKWCSANNVAIVPHGGRTGLAGGAASTQGQIVLACEQMNRIREIDVDGRVAIVDAGVTLQQIEDAVRDHGLTVGIDIGARGTCTLGGMVATNAGGGEAFRNGVMRQRVLGLEAVLPDGTVLEDLKRVIKANEGYDVKQLLIGSEGSLGVVTGVALKLENHIAQRHTILAAAPDARSGLSYFNHLAKAFGTAVLRAEIMWDSYFRFVTRALGFDGAFGHLDGGVYVILEVDAAIEEDALLEVLGDCIEAEDISDAVLAKNEQERQNIWMVREESFVVDRAFPDACWYDISVPLTHLDVFVEDGLEAIAAIDPDLQVFIIGHLGDGNLHYTVAKPEPVAHLYPQIAEALYSGLIEMGGSFSAEHGIGTEKRASLQKFGDPGKLAVMRAVKQALDPQGIMNPNKVLPVE